MSSAGPRATAAGGNSRPLICWSRVARSLSSWSAKRLGAGGRVLLPQVVLEPVPAGELRVVDALEVVDPGVDRAVDLLDQAGDGLDPLPADPAGGELLLGLGHVAGPDRVGELGRVGDQPVDLGHDPGLVVGHRLEDQLVVGGAAEVLPGQPRPGPRARARPGARPAGRALTADPGPVVLPAPGQQQHRPQPDRGNHPPDPDGPRLDPTHLTMQALLVPRRRRTRAQFLGKPNTNRNRSPEPGSPGH